MAKLTGKPKQRQEKEPIQAVQVKRRQQAPGSTIESRENQIIRLAYDLAEERIKKKTATGQEVIHFLKTGSSLAQLERAKLENENKLLKAKTESLESQRDIKELYQNAIQAMARYQGREVVQDDDD